MLHLWRNHPCSIRLARALMILIEAEARQGPSAASRENPDVMALPRGRPCGRDSPNRRIAWARARSTTLRVVPLPVAQTGDKVDECSGTWFTD